MGGHINSCPNGHYDQIAYNSCRHRSCPQCSWLAREQWLRKWKERLLPLPHHHCIFTLPHELNGLWFNNKAEYANVLFAAASQTLQELLLDPKYCGGRVGLLCALHTWNQSLLPHIHLHVLVTGGGLDEQDGSWRPLVKSCMLPRKVLMIKFRGKFKALLLKAVKAGKIQLPPGVTELSLKSLLRRLTSVNWNVKILEQYATGTGVVKYLANYLRGGPIGNSRLIDCQDGEVSFRFRLGTQAGGDGKKQGVCRLPAVKFIQRLLEHVLPSGFQAIRGYGLYCGNQHSRIGVARQALGVVVEVRFKEEQKQSWQDVCEASGYGEACRCPKCGVRLVAHSEFKRGRAPPFQFLGKTGKQGAA
jgi:hypothetical protein